MFKRSASVAATLSALMLLNAKATPVVDLPDIVITPTFESSSSGLLQIKLGQGLTALNKGDLAAAEDAFKGALALDPGVPGAYLGLAEIAGRRGDDQGVESWLKKGMSAAPRDVELLRTWGRWWARKGQWSEAEKAFSQAAQLTPKSAEILTGLGEVYLAQKKTLAKAETAFRKALAIDAGFIPAQVGLARALAGLGRAKEAQSVLDGAARAAPKDPMPLMASAHLAASQGKLKEAIKYLDQTIKMAPDFLPAYLDKGDLQLAQNNPKGAADSYRAGAARAKDPVPALFRLGVALEANQRWDEAEHAYLDAIARDPKLFGAYNNLAFMMAERKTNLDKALTWIQKASEIQPLSPDVRDTQGWIYRARGELAQAATILEEAKKLAPKNPSVRYHLGVVYSELGRKADAVAALKEALALNPNFRYASRVKEHLKQLGAE